MDSDVVAGNVLGLYNDYLLIHPFLLKRSAQVPASDGSLRQTTVLHFEEHCFVGTTPMV